MPRHQPPIIPGRCPRRDRRLHRRADQLLSSGRCVSGPTAMTRNEECDMATRLRWLGHSALLVEGEGRSVLIDPFLTGNPKAAAKAEEVPADLILISHG